MPTYEYLCEGCGDRFEKFQSITAETLRKCPNCGEMELKRLIGSGSGVIFRGSGFYETDYRSEGYKESAKKEAPKTEGGSDKKESASSDSAKTAEKKQADTGTKTSDSGGNSGKEK